MVRKVPLASTEISPTNGGAIDGAYLTAIYTRGVKSSSAAAWYCSTRAYSNFLLKQMCPPAPCAMYPARWRVRRYYVLYVLTLGRYSTVGIISYIPL